MAAILNSLILQKYIKGFMQELPPKKTVSNIMRTPWLQRLKIATLYGKWQATNTPTM